MRICILLGLFLSGVLPLCAQSVEDQLRDLERKLGNTEPTAAEQAQMRKDLEEITAMGLLHRAVEELKKKNPKVEVASIGASYFPNREAVPVSIIYSDPTAKSAQQEVVFQKKESGWTISEWRTPSILEAR